MFYYKTFNPIVGQWQEYIHDKPSVSMSYKMAVEERNKHGHLQLHYDIYSIDNYKCIPIK